MESTSWVSALIFMLYRKGGKTSEENMKKIKEAINNPQAKDKIKEVDEKFEEDKE
jgi:predicted KAP-like P-loop ATPase